MNRRNWNEEETCIALALYYKIPFGKIDKNNPSIIAVAEKLNRTPSALAMKMCNLAHFDKTLQRENKTGLPHGSKMDEYVWKKYAMEFDTLAQINESLKITLPNITDSIIHEGHNIEYSAKYRIGQQFFRDAVLSADNNTCCITGISIPELLIASHLKPWSKSDDKNEKANPRNGLCLNALHDRAFDQGYITLDKNYAIIVSDRLKKKRHLDEKTKEWICAYEGQHIILPCRSLPDLKYIEYHQDTIFQP